MFFGHHASRVLCASIDVLVQPIVEQVIPVMAADMIDRPRFRAGSPRAHLVAAVLVAAALLVRLALDPVFGRLPFGGLPYLVPFIAVVLAAFLCGTAAAVTAMGLSLVAVWAIIMPLHPSYLEPFQILAFAVGATTVIGVVAAMRRAGAKVRRLNESLQLSEARLVEASRAKSEFLARMSHELRTPLNAIIGFSEMIREAMIGPLDTRYRGYGADINAAGRHLQNIINDILDISKIEGGRLELRDEAVSIAETIEASRRIVAAMAEAAGVALAVEIPAGLPLLRSDALRFRQILLNLMSNAVKFTPAGGRVHVSAVIERDSAVIAVADTGIGMKREDIAIALEPFRQLDDGDAFTRRFDGTGLGLPLAKALVELHGGTLDIDSAPQAGTTVRIRLPLERAATEVAA
jgi:signal transduction histidine kinase